MRVWRIAPAGRLGFDGEGPRLFGGRWTPAGLRAVYASATLSLAALERFVNAEPDTQPGDLVAVSVDLPSDIDVDSVEAATLPVNWREYPAPDALRQIGRAWLDARRAPVLSVPSVVIPGERNYVLNPLHADFKKLTVGKAEPFSFDPRMWNSRERRRR